MSLLPKIDSPTYTVKLPVSKQDVKFRPYVVKEQKILLMAVESNEPEALIEAIAQIVDNCVLSPINARKLPVTDIEFLFYQLRARSQSESVDLKYKCENVVDEEICGGIMLHRLNLLTDLEITEALPQTIQITDKIGVKLNFQRFEPNIIKKSEFLTAEEEFNLVAKNIEFIYDETSSHSAQDIPKAELVEWLGNLTMEQYSKIGNFFANEPKIHKQINLKCKKCGTEHHIDVEDIFDFFD